MKPKLPIDQLRRLWSYDPETGEFTWLSRDRNSFGNEGAYRYFKNNLEGRPAFKCPNSSGYLTTIITSGGSRTNISAHVAAYALSYGKYPEALSHEPLEPG